MLTDGGIFVNKRCKRPISKNGWLVVVNGGGRYRATLRVQWSLHVTWPRAALVVLGSLSAQQSSSTVCNARTDLSLRSDCSMDFHAWWLKRRWFRHGCVDYVDTVFHSGVKFPKTLIFGHE